MGFKRLGGEDIDLLREVKQRNKAKNKEKIQKKRGPGRPKIKGGRSRSIYITDEHYDTIKRKGNGVFADGIRAVADELIKRQEKGE